MFLLDKFYSATGRLNSRLNEMGRDNTGNEQFVLYIRDVSNHALAYACHFVWVRL